MWWYSLLVLCNLTIRPLVDNKVHISPFTLTRMLHPCLGYVEKSKPGQVLTVKIHVDMKRALCLKIGLIVEQHPCRSAAFIPTGTCLLSAIWIKLSVKAPGILVLVHIKSLKRNYYRAHGPETAADTKRNVWHRRGCFSRYYLSRVYRQMAVFQARFPADEASWHQRLESRHVETTALNGKFLPLYSW